jgi:hypothetical protein
MHRPARRRSPPGELRQTRYMPVEAYSGRSTGLPGNADLTSSTPPLSSPALRAGPAVRRRRRKKLGPGFMTFTACSDVVFPLFAFPVSRLPPR